MSALHILADDLTGAIDTAAEFAAGHPPLAAFWHGGLPDDRPARVALDTGTREKTEAEARSIVAALAPGLAEAAAAGGIAFKKVDSLMRGPTLAELAACMTAGWDHCVFAPAFPFQGRVTRGGRQFARGIDGTWTQAGPDLVEALRAQGIPAQAVTPGHVLPPGISVFDAATDADLDAVVEGARGQRPLWCGTGGLARALAATAAHASALLPLPILGLFGSDQAATAAQLAACMPHWMTLPDGDADVAAALADRMRRGVALASMDLPPGLPRAEAAMRIGQGLAALARRLPRPGTLVVAGGETLRGLCISLGAASLEVHGRILPGLPRSVLRGGVWDGVTVVSKSGAFGPPGLLRNLLATNGLLERTSA